jgi:HSP20 family protein
MRIQAERLFGRPITGWALHHHPHAWQPPTDVYETEQAFAILVEVPGMQAGDFTVSLADNLLTISGVRPNPASRGICHQMEIHYGEFRTDVYIAAAIDAEAITAEYRDGFLSVTVPKARAHRIQVASNSQGRTAGDPSHTPPDPGASES